MRKATLTILGAAVLMIAIARAASAQEAWTSDPFFDPRIPQTVYGSAPIAADRQAAMEAVLAIPTTCGLANATFGDGTLASFRTRIAGRSWQMPAAKVLAHLAMTERNMSGMELELLVYGLANLRNADAQAALDALNAWAPVLVERFMSPAIPGDLWSGVQAGRITNLRRAIADAAARNGLRAP